MNAWCLNIAFIGAPSDENWGRAEQIVDELRGRHPEGRVGERHGAYWRFEYGTRDGPIEEAIADVERQLSEIDSGALELLRAEPAGPTNT